MELDEKLLYAAINGDLLEMKHYISQGADIHYRNESIITWCASKGHLDILMYLVSLGGRLDNGYNDALLMSSKEGQLDIVKYLDKNHINLKYENEIALRASSFNGKLPVVQYLIEKGGSLSIAKKYGDFVIQKWLSSIDLANTLEKKLICKNIKSHSEKL